MMIEKGDQDLVSRCSVCNQENMAITDPSSGEIICSNCGIVISDKINLLISSQVGLNILSSYPYRDSDIIILT
jgi:hypothetical protein